MWPFSKTFNLNDSGLFQGLTDFHSHILPGIDDGVRDFNDSLKILEEYERLGVKKVWLTPHIMEDFPNRTEDLKSRFNQLREKWQGKVEINLAAENMIDSLFEERIENNDLLPLESDGKYLLVETSYFNPPLGMKSVIERIKKKGFGIILAHPERYRYMEWQEYRELKKAGILFQINFMSLCGAYGALAMKKARRLLKNGMVDMVGSDLHSLDNLEFFLGQPFVKKDILKLLEIIKNRG